MRSAAGTTSSQFIHIKSQLHLTLFVSFVLANSPLVAKTSNKDAGLGGAPMHRSLGVELVPVFASLSLGKHESQPVGPDACRLCPAPALSHPTRSPPDLSK